MKMTEIINHLGKLVDSFLSRSWINIPVVALLGVYISYVYQIEMNEDVWFWFFSSIAQTFAALIALVAIFLFSRLELYNLKINNNIQKIRDSMPIQERTNANNIDDEKLIVDVTKYIDEVGGSENAFYVMKSIQYISESKEKKKQAINYMRTALIFTIPIIMLSIFLIPLGSPSDIKDIWVWNPTLKWAFIYSVVGLCISSLYKISSALGHFLNESE